MDNIRVSHGELGTVEVTPKNNISKRKKYMIKSLAFLQLVCMTPDNMEDDNFGEFLDLVSKTASDARELFKDKNESSSAIEQF
jgi:hypothetical protein